MVTVVALVAATVSVDVPPAAIEVGFAVIVTVGPVDAPTVTVAVAVMFPPDPLARGGVGRGLGRRNGQRAAGRSQGLAGAIRRR